MNAVRLVVAGAGLRAWAYSRPAVEAGARIVAVAEPDPDRRRRFAEAFGVPAAARFAHWEELAAAPRLGDAALVTTQDQLHVGPAVALAGLGYHLLLEKPMATTEEDCARIVEAVERAGVLCGVCHVLRYTPYTAALVAALHAGAIGELVSVQHLEPIGYWHFAHSFVRGNWSNEAASAFSLLTKSCHDLDWLAMVVNRPATRVASFGSLYQFRPQQAPAGAAARCLECPSTIERACPYSARRMYLEPSDPAKASFVRAVVDEPTRTAIEAALRSGPYGKCVYSADNDVADHQVVNIEYEGGVTASFTMAAFTPFWGRQTRIFGTLGYLEGNGSTFRYQRFVDESWHEVDPDRIDDEAITASLRYGHGGGDGGIAKAFVDAVRTGDASLLPTDAHTSYASHRVVFAAERARRTGTVVTL